MLGLVSGIVCTKFGGGHALVTLATVSAYTWFTFAYSNSRIPIRKAMNDAEAEVSESSNICVNIHIHPTIIYTP